MQTKEPKVAILDNSINPSVYNPVRHWSLYLKNQWKAFRPKEGKFPDLRDFSHLILTGSEASILERKKWVNDEIEFVKEAVEKGLSIFGSCYGHQVLAVALSGWEHVRRCVQPEIGWIPIQITKDNSLLGKMRTIYAFSSHFDEVFNLNENFSILSSSDKCAIQAFQWKGRPVWGVQFHPEMNIEEANRYIRLSLAKADDKKADYEQALDSIPRDSGAIRLIIANFLK
jgi:GMP synthase-like glutamine amidotransferase